MSSTVTLRALGLNNQPQQLSVAPGSMTIAKNVVINRDNVVEPRRGFAIYGNSFGTVSDRAKQLMNYKLRILRHFENTLQYDNGTGNFLSFADTVTEAQSGLRIKSIESNGNLYFTSSDGIKKISAKTAADFSTNSGVIQNAGAVKAIDVSAQLNYSYGDQTDFLVQDSAVAYRVVWGYRDTNNNLLLGTPSQRIEVYNSLLTLLLQDFAKLLGTLDDIGALGSMIDDQNYLQLLNLPISASSDELRTNLLALTTKLDQDLTFADAYKSLGSWNASTNTPTIYDNVNKVNDTYIVSTGGTQDLGNGSTTYSINNIVVYDGINWNIDTTHTYRGTFDANQQFLGAWSAASNIPTLADGTGQLNSYYRVNAAGTQNLGSGSQTFSVGDYVQYNGSTWIKNTSYHADLTNGTGNEGDVYRVTTAGTYSFGTNTATVTFAVNDFVVYSNGTWNRLQNTFNYIGTWDASTNTPFIHDATAQDGDYYTVSAGGTQNLGNGSITFTAGDRVLFNKKRWTIVNYTNAGTWNASTNTPVLVNGVGTEGTYYTVSVAGTQDLGNGPITYSVGQRLMYVSGVWTVNSFNINTNSPLKIQNAVIKSGSCTINFASGNPQTYFSGGSNIFLDGFTTDTGSINGGQVVGAVTATSLTFATTATITNNTYGYVGVDATAIVQSNEFRIITQPVVQDIPATDAELVSLQNYIKSINQALKVFSPSVISATLMTNYISKLTVTSAANVTLTISIPDGINSNYFFQVYRSALFQATNTQVLSTDVFPNDELQLAYEAFPTTAELSTKQITVIDVVPNDFLGANLYTNASTGEGIFQANDAPPFAKDLNIFKGSVFYSNTRTKYYKAISLLGVQNMINDYNAGIIPTFTIATASGSNTYKFTLGKAQQTTITCLAGSTLPTSGTAAYFDINSGTDVNKYRFWYQVGTAVAPSAGSRTLVPIVAFASDSNTKIAERTRNALNQFNKDFSASSSTNVVTVSANLVGYTTATSAGTTGFTVSTPVSGQGEKLSNKEILLSPNVSPAIAVQETALSLTKVVNHNSSDSVYIYYTSGAQEVPGKMTLESKTLGSSQFYLITNNNNTGISFSPTLAPEIQISSIATGTSATNLVTTASPHGLSNLDYVVISGSDSTPSIDGYYQITYVSPTTFRLPITITAPGSKGGLSKASEAVTSSNLISPNRVYYSKLQQPEAVPSVNYLDIGAQDKEILRIFPIRDSLFVFKQDGLYRISGEAIPFNVALFDISCILIAPDSVSAVDNVIYGWTRQGITAVTESGARNAGRPIDVTLLPLAASNNAGFISSTWGIGYESDKSYTVFTIKNPSDTQSMQGFKFNVLTNTWVNLDKDYQCGVINFADDKMYAGCGDINNIEQERKNFDRYDYADREYINQLLLLSNNTTVILDNGTTTNKNDVLVQNQTVTIYIFNQLLQRLDIDPGVPSNNYFSSLQAFPGNDMRSKLVALAQKLDSDGLQFTSYFSTIDQKTGSITGSTNGSNVITITSNNHGLFTGRIVLLAGTDSTPSLNGEYQVTVIDANNFSIQYNGTIINSATTGTFSTVVADFTDLQACYNKLISLLNLDSVVSYSNYLPISNITSIETLVADVNRRSDTVLLSTPAPFIKGAISTFKSIDSVIQYSPITFGDPISLKHLRESQIMFENLAFTGGVISFATDLLPAFEDVDFVADGNGFFGYPVFGTGFFGGASDSAPIRTYIPRNSQRCRYIIVKFNHNVAREKWSLYGISLTGEILPSTRAFR